MIQHLSRKFLRFRMRHILAEPGGIQTGLVHSDEPDGGKMVFKRAKIPFGIWIKTFLHQFGDDLPLDFQRARRNIHEMVEPAVKLFFVFRKIGDARHVDRDDAHGACALSASEKAARFFAELPQIQTQPAAHAPNVARLHIAVDIV